MLKTYALALAAAVGLTAAATSAQAAVILSAGPNALCSSAGCFNASHSYQQTYAAGGYSGAVSIAALQLDKSLLGQNGDLAVKVSFKLADGTKVASWGSYTLASLGGDVVTIGGQAVAWDTALGDLILQLDLIVPEKGGGGGGGGGGFGGGGGGGWSSLPVRPAFGGLDGGMPSGSPTARLLPPDMVPAITTPGAVPEPASWALMILGFGASGAILRNSRRRHYRFG